MDGIWSSHKAHLLIFHRGQEIGGPNLTSEHLSNPNKKSTKKSWHLHLEMSKQKITKTIFVKKKKTLQQKHPSTKQKFGEKKHILDSPILPPCFRPLLSEKKQVCFLLTNRRYPNP